MALIDIINDLLGRIENFTPASAAEIEDFRVKILGRKGELNDILEEFKTVPAEEKRLLGQKINAVKTRANERIAVLKERADEAPAASASSGDLSSPALIENLGSRHPISLVRNEI